MVSAVTVTSPAMERIRYLYNPRFPEPLSISICVKKGKATFIAIIIKLITARAIYIDFIFFGRIVLRLSLPRIPSFFFSKFSFGLAEMIIFEKLLWNSSLSIVILPTDGSMMTTFLSSTDSIHI